jgi:hypothetical protein
MTPLTLGWLRSLAHAGQCKPLSRTSLSSVASC